MKFKCGDKVTPISKSISSSLNKCYAWRKAQKDNQNYLIFIGIDDDGHYICINEIDYKPGIINDGYYFLENDLIPYKLKITGRKYFKPNINLSDALIDSISKDLSFEQIKKEIEHDFGYIVTKEALKILEDIYMFELYNKN